MQISKIEATLRDPKKEKSKRLRREGFVPAVLYGHNDETKSIKIGHNEIRNLVAHHGSKSKLDIDLSGETNQVFIKELQKDIINGDILSVDFQILYQNEVVKMSIPISFLNTSKMTETDYILHEDLNSIELEALPRDLPELISVDVEGITPDTPIRISDLEISKSENIRIIDDLDTLVASAHFKKEMIEEEEEGDEDLEPELIGEENEEEEEENEEE